MQACRRKSYYLRHGPAAVDAILKRYKPRLDFLSGIEKFNLVSYVTLRERCIIARMLQRKIGTGQIGRQLQRQRSTIHNEIRRNF